MIKCRVCHKEFLTLSGHVRTHGLSKNQYLSRFPSAPYVSQEFCQRAGMPPKYKVNAVFFDSWSPNMAYCLGLLLADGYILVQPRAAGKYIAGFGIDSIDRDLPQNIKLALEAEAPVLKITPIKNKSGSITQRFRLTVHNHKIGTRLISLGCKPNKSKNVTLPQIPLDLEPFFMRGFFEGDGTIATHRRHKGKGQEIQLGFVSGSKIMMQQILDILQKNQIGTRRKVYTAKNKGASNPHYRLLFGKLDAARFFRYAYAAADFSCKFYLARKYETFLNLELDNYYGRIY